MRISIRHATLHRYAGAASNAVFALRLTPQDTLGQRVAAWELTCPGIAAAARYTDAFGNIVHLAALPAAHEAVEIAVRGEVETTDTGGVAGHTGEAVSAPVFLRPTPATAPDAAIAALAARARGATRLDTAHRLMAEVHAAIAYVPSATTTATTAAQALAAGRGVCQDHAHVMLAAARLLGLPARYVTGYLALDDGAAAAAHHAWVEVAIEQLGWVGFDAANDVCPTDRYVRLASGVDAAAAAPIRGTRRGGAGETMTVTVQVATDA